MAVYGHLGIKGLSKKNIIVKKKKKIKNSQILVSKYRTRNEKRPDGRPLASNENPELFVLIINLVTLHETKLSLVICCPVLLQNLALGEY